VKPELVSPDRAKSAATWKNLFAAFESALRLLHPFMPFITEELWHQLPQRDGARSIALDRFPEACVERIDEKAELQIAMLQDVIVAARNIRAELKVDQKAKVGARLSTSTQAWEIVVAPNVNTIQRLGSLSSFNLQTHEQMPFDASKGSIRTTKDFELFIPYDTAFDVKAEIARLRKDRERLSKDIESKQSRLGDQTFLIRAPEHIVKGLETTLAERQAELEKLRERLAQLETL